MVRTRSTMAVKRRALLGAGLALGAAAVVPRSAYGVEAVYESIPADAEAAGLLSRTYRAPWSLPRIG